MYIQRYAELSLRRYLSAFPVVGLTGPRQSGKSTLLKHCLPDYEYVTFDLDRHVKDFENDPEGFLQAHKHHVIFDEVQFVPKLFNAIKVLVDNNRQEYGQYVMTGSSQFSCLRLVSESLAGRMGLMTLLPFQYGEIPKALRDECVHQGSYPELVLRNYKDADFWYDAYLDTYLSKDVRAMTNIGDLRDFRRLIQLLASNTSQVLDMSYYARDIGVSLPTIKRWLSVLEASYVIFLLPPYYSSIGKRIVKRPKVYFHDTGLVSHLTGIRSYEMYDKGPLAGALFENHVIANVMKSIKHHALSAELYYLKTQDKAEVDLIVDWKNSCDYLEIKKSSSYQPKMALHIKRYAQEGDRKIILYNGDAFNAASVEVMPYYDYLAELAKKKR